VEYPYLADDTTWVAMGGETCRVNRPRSECETALQELQMFHYTYLNQDYRPEVIDDWATHGCKTEMDKRLGYRLTLVSAFTTPGAKQGHGWHVKIVVRNDGWSAPINKQTATIVFRAVPDGAPHTFALQADPRRWQAGTTTIIDENVNLTDVAAGTYRLYLRIADDTLPDRPEYAIQTANQYLWDPSTGANFLHRTVRVSE
jgi:hypothetical protein